MGVSLIDEKALDSFLIKKYPLVKIRAVNSSVWAKITKGPQRRPRTPPPPHGGYNVDVIRPKTDLENLVLPGFSWHGRVVLGASAP